MAETQQNDSIVNMKKCAITGLFFSILLVSSNSRADQAQYANKPCNDTVKDEKQCLMCLLYCSPMLRDDKASQLLTGQTVMTRKSVMQQQTCDIVFKVGGQVTFDPKTCKNLPGLGEQLKKIEESADTIIKDADAFKRAKPGSSGGTSTY